MAKILSLDQLPSHQNHCTDPGSLMCNKVTLLSAAYHAPWLQQNKCMRQALPKILWPLWTKTCTYGIN